MLLLLLLGTPLVVGLISLLGRSAAVLHSINGIGAAAVLALGLITAGQVFNTGTIKLYQETLVVDPLSALIIVVIAGVGFLAAVYSIGYLQRELDHQILKISRLKYYYAYFYFFLFAMFLVVTVNNLGLMWAAIEATTIISALLVAFNNQRTSLEAAWKYILICTVGIAFALLGIIFLYAAAAPLLGHGNRALDWTAVIGIARQLDPRLVKLVFIFILVGFGTKAGLAPMHTWLPDAHSQAPTPASALLSGVLLNCSLYGIIRFHLIATTTLGTAFSGNLLIIFGLLSVAVAVPFIILQQDLKRMLAYSSVEHIGIVTLAIGFGGKIGVYGAVLHLLNHALVKSQLFLLSGDIVQKYHTKKMPRIKGLIRSMPLTGWLLLLGGLAITGIPPFNVFISEFIIISAGFSGGNVLAGSLLAVLVALIFAGVFYHLSKMVFGAPPVKVEPGELRYRTSWLTAIPLVAILLLGLYIPPYLNGVVNQVVEVLLLGR